MRATWPGARSGRIAITTSPLLVSMMSVSSGFSMSAMSSSFRRVCRDFHADDLVGVLHHAVLGARALLDLIDGAHAVNHLADDRILAVQPGRIAERDEELRIGAVRVFAPRHADDAACERRVGHLRLEVRQVGAAGAGTGRIAGLR